MELAQYIAPAAAGLISGVIGSLFAPWVQWGVESRRERMKARRALLVEARSFLADPPLLEVFRRHPLYFQIKHLLSEKTNRTISGEFDKHGNEVIQVALGAYGGVDPYAHNVLEELSLAEKKWGLV